MSLLKRDFPFSHPAGLPPSHFLVFPSILFFLPHILSSPMSMISGALSSQGSDMLYVELSVFNTFAFLGLFLNAGVLAPALWSSRIRRRSGWFSLIISWMIYSITYLMIVGHQTGPAPPFGRCLAQAVLIYAIPPMCVEI